MSVQKLVWLDSFRFTGVDSLGNEISIDATEGSNEGVKPADLLPISLAACTAYELVSILRKQRQDLRALETTIESTQGEELPRAFTKIAVTYVARGSVDEQKARKALELSESKYCSVSATLRDTVELTFDIRVESD